MGPRLTYEQSKAAHLHICFLKIPSNPANFVPQYLDLLLSTGKIEHQLQAQNVLGAFGCCRNTDRNSGEPGSEFLIHVQHPIPGSSSETEVNTLINKNKIV